MARNELGSRPVYYTETRTGVDGVHYGVNVEPETNAILVNDAAFFYNI